MSALVAHDGTKLAYHVIGDGRPLICLPGGPMQDSAYLGDLGGLSARLRLIRLDLRGTGQSATPEDTSSYGCDRLVDDVEALREHLGLDRIDLLAHSAGANLAERYAIRYPARVRRLVLITPSTMGVGIMPTSDVRREIISRRAAEPAYAQVSAAFERIASGAGTEDDWAAIVPFTYGRWDDVARAHHAAQQQNVAAAAVYGDYTPDATRAGLASVDVPVLVLAGELDLAGPPRAVAELVGLFADATFVTQVGAGHMPWLDDPEWFVATVAGFLG